MAPRNKQTDVRQGALAALVANLSPVDAPTEPATSLPLERLRAGAFQARRTFDEASLTDLAQSLKTQGVLQPLLVRPGPPGIGTDFEIVAGERRWRAAQLAGLTSVPVIIRELTDDEALDAGAVENLQREDLNVIDEIDLVVKLVARHLGLSAAEVPVRLNVLANRPQEDPETVTRLENLFAGLGRESWKSFTKNKVRILRWPAPILQAMRERGLGYTVAGVVAAAPAEHQAALLKFALDGVTKTQLRERVLSFRKDKPVDHTQKVVRALQNRKALSALDEQQRQRVSELLQELNQLFDGTSSGKPKR
ncbi:ParB/RepB/Spo0J family partition protein [Deinococcus sp. QL22]|uniref:ParB/RepB/Spo0J family partition protein n=1 Tax=Deinococcus sp. QL22 TaxID=2939437 RepID=UPI00211521FB|nr:ParB/RepB/Spo0J family partition protein [Deinococcus sp. QL22]